MTHLAKWFAFAVFLAISVPLVSQEVFHSDNVGFARFSYFTSSEVQPRGMENVCFAVSPEGEYRIVRFGTGGTHGKMSDEDFRKFKALIEADEFRSLSGDHSGLIRQRSENFRAEIPWSVWEKHGRTQQFHWLNADSSLPFPLPAAKVIEWMKNFHPKDGELFDSADFPDVCPSGGLRYVQPSVAKNGPN
jgi:hypothetical protein